MKLVLALAKRVLPVTWRQALRMRHQAYVLHKALGQFRRAPQAVLEADSPLLKALIYGWGNEAWAAMDEYLRACIAHALEARGPILECGSGLTTLLLGTIAQKRGLTLWTLEHNPFWSERILTALQRHGLNQVRVLSQPLRDYGDYVWYDPPLSELPPYFELIICDGPPSSTPGGRYGLVPTIKSYLRPGSIILLDDAGREGEQLVVQRWQAELPCRIEVRGKTHAYARLSIESAESAPRI